MTIGDYNNDGFDDIFISQWGQNVLYRNNGDGTFTDVTREAGLLHEGRRWGTGCTWVDYNRDGLLDLFVSHYLVFDFQSVPATGQNPKCNFRGVPVYCGPLEPATRAVHALSQQRRWHVHRRDHDPRESTARRPLSD